jgi:hypothetical protein
LVSADLLVDKPFVVMLLSSSKYQNKHQASVRARDFQPRLFMQFSRPLFTSVAVLGLAVLPFFARATVSVTVQPPSQIALVGSNATFNAQVNVTAGETITAYT